MKGRFLKKVVLKERWFLIRGSTAPASVFHDRAVPFIHPDNPVASSLTVDLYLSTTMLSTTVWQYLPPKCLPSAASLVFGDPAILVTGGTAHMSQGKWNGK